ncbi:MAG: DUF6797 domain-containing protein, partial [Verrucomicrobiota bacterium]
MQKYLSVPVLFFVFFASCLFANGEEPGTKWDVMDTGPFFTCGFAGKYPAVKAISIKLGKNNEAAVCFDTELLRMTMGWTGGFLKLPSGRGGLEGIPEPIGTPIFWTPNVPGWAKDGSFADPRPKRRDNKASGFPNSPADIPYGSLPKDWAHYRGLYLHDEQVILSYTVGKSDVLEMPEMEIKNGLRIFSRTFQIKGSGSPMSLLVCESGKAATQVEKNLVSFFPENGTNEIFGAAAFVGAPKDTTWETNSQGWLVLHLPKTRKNFSFKVLLASSEKIDLIKFHAALPSDGKIEDLESLCHGGATQWGDPLATHGVLGKESGPYQVDTLTLPEENPWKSWIRPSGFDFFSDGRAALCSVSGDVWIISGIDQSLRKLTWKRFATGLYQPLGLKIVKDKIYVRGRDQITRLQDLNNDGEADFYENFNNDVFATPRYHEFVLNLETDSKGNFYFTKGGDLNEAVIPHQGTLMKVSPNGRKLEVVATGLRAPNGLGMGPHDEITTSDNEGNWVPASRINLMKPGGFYGHVFTAHRDPKPTNYDDPLLWIPHNNNVDNSSGGQVWVTSKKWGPFYGKMFHTSYGTCSLFEIMPEKVEGKDQAAAFRFPLKFETGIMRGRFNQKDGQLYLCGLSVWQSNAGKEGGFQRVRYTGKTVNYPCAFHVLPQAIQIIFAAPLKKDIAADAGNYSIEQWAYHWTANYGSPEFSIKNPEEKKHDSVEIKSVTVSADGKTVTLEIPGLQPVMQMKIKYNLSAADGAELQQEIFNTIYR